MFFGRKYLIFFNMSSSDTDEELNVSHYDVDLNACGSAPVHTTEAAVNALPVLPAPIHTRTQGMFKVKLFIAFILVVFGFIK